MKKTFKSLLGVFLAVLMVVSLMAVPSSAAAKLSKTSVTVTKGYQTTLTVSGASNVTWSTGDKSVATVSKGKVVGKGVGSTYIYAKTGKTTLKCKVTVVPSKITASKSTVELDSVGDSAIVTMTVTGSHSGLSVGTTNKSVASATWVKPVEWNGDKIKLKITAKGKGSGRIKVYLKNYASTCYKYIDVTVGDSLYEDPDDEPASSSGTMNIIPYSNSVEVNAGSSTTLQVYSSNQSNMGFSVSNVSIANVTAGTTSGNYRTFTIKGINSGTTSVRFYDKKNTKKYVDVTITVGGKSQYYEFYTVKPSTINTTDQILNIQVSSTLTYYMLVPANYDPAYTNGLIAQKIGKYSYYTVYNNIPSKTAAGDTYYSFNHINMKYNYGVRYVLVPSKYDEVKLNTAIAKYNDLFEHYVVYSENPVKQTSWDDIKTWTIMGSNGSNITRYMLIPYNYDSEKVNDIIEKDKNSNAAYSYYVPYSSYPTVNNSVDTVVTYTKNGSWRYIVVPKTGNDVALKRNDAIQKDTGVFEAYVMYSKRPNEDTAKGEHVVELNYGGQKIYILCTYPKDSEEDTKAFNSAFTKAPIGT